MNDDDALENTMFKTDWYQRALMEVVGHWSMWMLLALCVGLWVGSEFQADADTDRPTLSTVEVVE